MMYAFKAEFTIRCKMPDGASVSPKCMVHAFKADDGYHYQYMVILDDPY